MGLNIFINGMSLYAGWLPVAVSSGLKGSQSATKPLAPSTSARLTESQSAAKPSAPTEPARFARSRRATKLSAARDLRVKLNARCEHATSPRRRFFPVRNKNSRIALNAHCPACLVYIPHLP